MVLIAGLLFLPLSTQLYAQQSAGKPAEAKKTEAQEMDVYRHAVPVQWIAKTLHTDVEATAKTFELINFGIIVLAIGIPLFRILPKAFKKHNEEIRKKLVDARSATEQAQQRLSGVEARLANLDAEIATIRAQVEADSELDKQSHLEQVEAEKKRIVASAEQEIAVAAAAAHRELKRYAADLALDGAISRISLTPETDRELINEFARDLGKGAEN
jgi:F-type H+-transporting ATPase subunit b